MNSKFMYRIMTDARTNGKIIKNICLTSGLKPTSTSLILLS